MHGIKLQKDRYGRLLYVEQISRYLNEESNMVRGKHLNRISRETSTYSLAQTHNKLKLTPTVGSKIINYKYVQYTSILPDRITRRALHHS